MRYSSIPRNVIRATLFASRVRRLRSDTSSSGIGTRARTGGAILPPARCFSARDLSDHEAPIGGLTMSTLRLSFGCGEYDRTRPLTDRKIAIEGVELDWERVDVPHELFVRV